MSATQSSLAEFQSCPELCAIFGSRSVIGENGKVFTGLAALSSLNNLFVLRRLMAETKPEKTLEIGLCFGGSALVFAATHRDLGRPPEAQHIAIDPYQESVWDNSGLAALEKANLLGYVDHRAAFSAFELPRLIEAGIRIDLAYVDGSHLFEDAFVDAYFILRILNERGFVLFDDSTNPHVAKVLRYLRANLRGSLEEVDLAEYRSQYASRSKYWLASRVNRVQLSAFRLVGDAVRTWDARFEKF